MIVVHVNTNICISREGHRLHYPFGTEEARSLEEIHHLLQTRGSIFGHRLELRRENDGWIILAERALILALPGVAQIEDWSRGPIRRVEIEA